MIPHRFGDTGNSNSSKRMLDDLTGINGDVSDQTHSASRARSLKQEVETLAINSLSHCDPNLQQLQRGIVKGHAAPEHVVTQARESFNKQQALPIMQYTMLLQEQLMELQTQTQTAKVALVGALSTLSLSMRCREVVVVTGGGDGGK